MSDYELNETCSDCGTNLIFTTEDDEVNEHGEPAVSCPACLDLKRTGRPEAQEGDVIGFIHDGEQVSGKVQMIGHSGTLRVRGVGAVDIEPDQVIEVLERAE